MAPASADEPDTSDQGSVYKDTSSDSTTSGDETAPEADEIEIDDEIHSLGLFEDRLGLLTVAFLFLHSAPLGTSIVSMHVGRDLDLCESQVNSSGRLWSGLRCRVHTHNVLLLLEMLHGAEDCLNDVGGILAPLLLDDSGTELQCSRRFQSILKRANLKIELVASSAPPLD
ncbi:hypothetical protein SGCOL_001703 [Colletotrichum sp. CLE4]